MRLGFTGHQSVPPEALDDMARSVRLLTEGNETVLITSLAAGADQAAAAAVLAEGGRLDVIVPCENYESTFADADLLDRYMRLSLVADRISSLPYPTPSELAFMAAGLITVERCDKLLAMWDGQPSRGLGGTADVVEYAHQLRKPVHNLWPTGLLRE